MVWVRRSRRQAEKGNRQGCFPAYPLGETADIHCCSGILSSPNSRCIRDSRPFHGVCAISARKYRPPGREEAPV